MLWFLIYLIGTPICAFESSKDIELMDLKESAYQKALDIQEKAQRIIERLPPEGAMEFFQTSFNTGVVWKEPKLITAIVESLSKVSEEEMGANYYVCETVLNAPAAAYLWKRQDVLEKMLQPLDSQDWSVIFTHLGRNSPLWQKEEMLEGFVAKLNFDQISEILSTASKVFWEKGVSLKLLKLLFLKGDSERSKIILRNLF